MAQNEAVKHAQKVEQVIDLYIEEPQQASVKAMLDSIGEQYFTAPASTRKDLGYAYPGGLLA